MSLEFLFAPDDGDAVRSAIDQAVRQDGWPDFELRHQLGAYHAAIADRPFKDLSAVVLDAGRLSAFVLANDAGAGIGYFGLPLHFEFADGRENTAARAAKRLYRHYLDIARQRACDIAVGSRPEADATLAPVAREALAHGAVLEPHYRAVVDLEQPEAEIWRRVRKSYRPLITWGREQLETRILTAEPAHEAFEAYRAFHAQVAGRVTRPAESWAAQRELVTQGRAELILAYSHGALVAATLVNFNRHYASYASGAYDRTRFDKPLSHWPVYLAIRRACERGNSRFDLGAVFLPAETDRKAADIGFFKKGFTDRVEFRPVYRSAHV